MNANMTSLGIMGCLSLSAVGDFLTRRGFFAGRLVWMYSNAVCLVMVADLSKFGGEVLMPALDAGIVSQNISLFCSGTGLVTVPRASMDQAKLKSGLKLKDTQRPLINHPVGYAK